MDTERRLFKALGGWRCHSQKKISTKTQKPPQKKTRKRQKKAKNETFPKSEKAKKNEKNSFAFLCPPAPIHPSPAQDAGGGEYAKNRSSLSFSRKKIGCHTQIPARTPSRRVVLEQKKKTRLSASNEISTRKMAWKKNPWKKICFGYSLAKTGRHVGKGDFWHTWICSSISSIHPKRQKHAFQDVLNLNPRSTGRWPTLWPESCLKGGSLTQAKVPFPMDRTPPQGSRPGQDQVHRKKERTKEEPGCRTPPPGTAATATARRGGPTLASPGPGRGGPEAGPILETQENAKGRRQKKGVVDAFFALFGLDTLRDFLCFFVLLFG